MNRLWISLWLVVIGIASAHGATRGEERAFDAAAKAFQDTDWLRADWEFGDFLRNFPESERKAEAILWQATARFQVGNHSGAIELLNAHLGGAGNWTDQYVYWLGEAHFQAGDFEQAAEAYGRVAQKFPQSARRLEAAYREAAARFELARSENGQLPLVVELLQSPEGAFQQAAKANPVDPFVPRALLLMAEVQLLQKDYASVRKTLEGLWERVLVPELSWQRQFLSCRLLLAEEKMAESLAASTNLFTLADTPELRAESVVFQSGLFERLGRLDDAAGVYEKNLAGDLSETRRRQALLKMIELRLTQNKLALATQRLQQFVTNFPADPAADLALLTLGETFLKSAAASESPASNQLAQARIWFERIANDIPQSQVAPQARLNLGWCLWLEKKYEASLAQFKSAAETLPLSEDQAIARFKWADAQFEIKDYKGAMTNYSFVADHYRPLAPIGEPLIEPALYQIVRAGLADDQLHQAIFALGRILEWFPNGFFTGRSLLLIGKGLNDQGDAAKARTIFADALQRLTNAAVLPEIYLAIARTHETENNWLAAIEAYDLSLTRFPADATRPRAEYHRALASYRAGLETNAFNLFTNFVVRYPTNDLAPLAQFWIGDYYFRRGEDFRNAEESFRLLFQKWPASELAAPARLMAGKSAFARQDYGEARNYFLDLINALPKGTNKPPEILAEAYFALGDTLIERYKADKLPDDFGQAINAFDAIGQDFPTNRLAILALGLKGNSYLQRAAIAQDPASYDAASNAYQRVIESPYADPAARSEASVGLAKVLEKQAAGRSGEDQVQLLRRALDQCENVVYEKNLRDEETRGDPFWMQAAGLEAARLAESLGAWGQAIKIYERLEKLLPPLRPAIEEKIARAEEKSRVKSN